MHTPHPPHFVHARLYTHPQHTNKKKMSGIFFPKKKRPNKTITKKKLQGTFVCMLKARKRRHFRKMKSSMSSCIEKLMI